MQLSTSKANAVQNGMFVGRSWKSSRQICSLSHVYFFEDHTLFPLYSPCVRWKYSLLFFLRSLTFQLLVALAQLFLLHSLASMTILCLCLWLYSLPRRDEFLFSLLPFCFIRYALSCCHAWALIICFRHHLNSGDLMRSWEHSDDQPSCHVMSCHVMSCLSIDYLLQAPFELWGLRALSVD